MGRRIRVASASEVPPGSAKVVEAEGNPIALFDVNGTFHAIDGVCPHAGGPLGEGSLEGGHGHVPAAWLAVQHRYGRVLHAPVQQTCYNIVVQGGDMLVEL